MVKGKIRAILVYILIYTFTVNIVMVFYFTSKFYLSITLSVKCGNILILLSSALPTLNRPNLIAFSPTTLSPTLNSRMWQ